MTSFQFCGILTEKKQANSIDEFTVQGNIEAIAFVQPSSKLADSPELLVDIPLKTPVRVLGESQVNNGTKTYIASRIQRLSTLP